MWGANAFSAAIQRLTGLGIPASTTDCHPTSAAISGTAQNTQSKLCRDVTRLMERRADKATNKSLRALYLRQHQNLIRGR